MKDPMRLIERFCYKHPRFGIPNLMLYVTGGNVLFWLLGMINPVLMSYMIFSPSAILHGQVWRLVSFLLIPPSGGLLALIAFYFYYWIGTTLTRQWGDGPFTIYFFSGSLLSVIYAFLVYFISGIDLPITGTYIYLAMFFAFAVFYPDMQVLLFFIIPVKIKYLAYVDAVFFLLEVIRMPFPLNLLPLIAMVNFLICCGGELLGRLPKRASRNTVNFRRESQRVRREQAQQLYRHKCAVCGRTDKDFPNLEFRYCSRCAGYHCFCQDHINNHIHFTE